MAMIELVDFNDIYSQNKLAAKGETKKRTRRSKKAAKPAGGTAE